MLEKIKNKWAKYTIFLLMFFFVLITLYLANNVQFGAPPDEVFHFNQINNFKNSPHFFLEDDELLQATNPDIAPEPMKRAYYSIRSKSSFFYHWSLGRLLHLNFFNISDLLFLRFINILFSLLYLYFFYKLALLILKDKGLVTVAFLLHVIIPMFLFLSAAVSYDNLVNLVSIISLYYLFRFIDKKKIEYLFIILIFILLGVLTKFTFLPLAGIIGIVLIWQIIKNQQFVWQSLKSLFYKNKLKFTVLLSLLIILFLSNFFIFFKNFVNYKNILPNCQLVFTQQICWEEDYIFQRNKIFTNTLEKPQAGLSAILKYSYNWINFTIDRTVNLSGHMQHTSFRENFLLAKFFICVLFMSLLFNFKTKNTYFR